MGQRRDRLNKRRLRSIATRQENSTRKEKEHTRRDEQMRTLLKEGQLPYTPGVMSWLSTKLSKKAARITAEDVKSLI